MQHKTALVTGGSSGIGLAIVSRLVATGATVHTTGRNAARWQRVVDLRPELAAATFHAVDMAALSALDELAAAVASSNTHGSIDLLINNAGLMTLAPLHQQDAASVAEHLAVLLHGPIRLTQAALRQMLQASTRGQIINVSSAVALGPAPGLAVYGAAKAALVHFTRSVAAEYAAQGIVANAVCPGPVDTGLADPMLLERLGRMTPAGRLASAEQVADLVMMLVQAQHGSFNGSVLTMDGGASLGLNLAPAAASEPAPPQRGEAPTGATSSAPPAARALDPAQVAQVAGVIAEIFSFEGADADTTPQQVPRWDSLGHLNLVSALERRFGVQFGVDEVMEMISVAAIVQVLARKLQSGTGESAS